MTPSGRHRHRHRRRRPAVVTAAVAVGVAVVAAGLGVAWTTLRARSPHEDLRHLPLRVVADLPLGGGSSRFDYLSLDPTHDRLYLAHLGADLVTVVLASLLSLRRVLVLEPAVVFRG